MAERKITWRCTNTLLLLVACHLFAVSADTNPDDAAALAAIYKQWKKTPPSWSKGDPCGKWEGVDCENSRVISLRLSTLGLQGNLADVMTLSQLQVLDLSFNDGFGDSIPPSIGNLTNLRILILAGCNLTGPIPSELGNLGQLTFLALNNNKLTGTIPPSLGKLSELYWLDIAENMLTGPLPVSSASSPGLDMLLKTKHFHFNRNKLSGSIPPRLFSSEMILIHILFDGNQFSGEIPYTIGYVKSLEVLRLDRNSFSSNVPSSLGSLTLLNELNLAGNKLTGPIPDLTNMSNLNYVDLSNNSFDTTTAPSWFTSLHSLTTLTMESAMLVGEVPQPLLSLPSLQKLKLKKNSFNGTLDMGDSISPQLQLVDLEYNQIHKVTLGNSYGNTLLLAGNPACPEVGNRYCLPPNSQAKPYSTSLANCTGGVCPHDPMQRRNPQSCECAYPYQGILQFRAPRFSDLTNKTPFQALERNLWTQFGLTPGSVLLQNPQFDEGDYMRLYMALFPSNGMYFQMSDVFKIGFQLNNHTFKQPPVFGPYAFQAFVYPFPEPNGRDLRSGEIIGIATGSTVLILVLIAERRSSELTSVDPIFV